MLVEIYSTLVFQILASYNADSWWARWWLQIQRNIDLGMDAATLSFVLGFTPLTDADTYINTRL